LEKAKEKKSDIWRLQQIGTARYFIAHNVNIAHAKVLLIGSAIDG
jgi:hypothetical protein